MARSQQTMGLEQLLKAIGNGQILEELEEISMLLKLLQGALPKGESFDAYRQELHWDYPYELIHQLKMILKIIAVHYFISLGETDYNREIKVGIVNFICLFRLDDIDSMKLLRSQSSITKSFDNQGMFDKNIKPIWQSLEISLKQSNIIPAIFPNLPDIMFDVFKCQSGFYFPITQFENKKYLDMFFDLLIALMENVLIQNKETSLEIPQIYFMLNVPQDSQADLLNNVPTNVIETRTNTRLPYFENDTNKIQLNSSTMPENFIELFRDIPNFDKIETVRSGTTVYDHRQSGESQLQEFNFPDKTIIIGKYAPQLFSIMTDLAKIYLSHESNLVWFLKAAQFEIYQWDSIIQQIEDGKHKFGVDSDILREWVNTVITENHTTLFIYLDCDMEQSRMEKLLNEFLYSRIIIIKPTGRGVGDLSELVHQGYFPYGLYKWKSHFMETEDSKYHIQLHRNSGIMLNSPEIKRYFSLLKQKERGAQWI